MKQKADVMVSGRIQSEKLAVESVRKPGQRMPIPGMKRRKGPLHCGPGDARENRRITDDIWKIVQQDKPVVSNRVVKSESGRKQRETNNQSSPLVSGWDARGRNRCLFLLNSSCGG